MIKHFCDRCKKEMAQADFSPFIRLDRQTRIFVSVLPCDENNKSINDVCRLCIKDIVVNGEPVNMIGESSLRNQPTPMKIPQADNAAPPNIVNMEKEKVATLQPEKVHAFDTVVPAILPYEKTSPTSPEVEQR